MWRGECGTGRGEEENALMTDNNEEVLAHIDEIAHTIRASVMVVMQPILELIYRDPHQWSRRPCSTCQSITSMIGQPFGCYRYQKEHPRG